MINDLQIDASRTALVIFDLLELYRKAAEDAGVIPRVRRLGDACRERGSAVAWARADHRADGLDYARCLADEDIEHRRYGPEHPRESRPPYGSGSPMYQSLPELGQRSEDYDVPKHRFSAFHGTHLDVSLRSRDIDTVLLVGGSTHVGVASTVYDARDRDYQVIVIRDGLTGRQPQRDFFVEHVFPRICRVRTVKDIIAAMDGPSIRQASDAPEA